MPTIKSRAHLQPKEQAAKQEGKLRSKGGLKETKGKTNAEYRDPFLNRKDIQLYNTSALSDKHQTLNTQPGLDSTTSLNRRESNSLLLIRPVSYLALPL